MQFKKPSYIRASPTKPNPTLSSSLKFQKDKNGNTKYDMAAAAVLPASSTSLADSISVASSTATPRTMNTTRLGSGSGRKNNSTALTLRSGSSGNNSSSNGATPGSPKLSSSKRARTDGENNGEVSSSDIVPIERRPLPSARELSKVLCRIVDDEAYTERDAEIALETLHHWALKQNVAFGNHFADVGGLQQVLFFVEDHIEDCKCIMPAFWLMETLCKPLQGASATIYESKALSNMRTKIGKCIVDVGGIHLMLRTFQFHGLPTRGVTSNTTMNSEESSKNRKSLTRSSSTSGSSERSSDNKENDGDECGKELGMWKAIKTMLKTNHGLSEDVIMNPCSAIDVPILCMSQNADIHVTNIDDDVNLLEIDTARHSLEVLALLIPHVIGVDKTAPGKIIQTLCDSVPTLLSEMKTKCKINYQDSNDQTPTKVEKVYESLVASVLKCLVATTAVASKDTFTTSQCAKAKSIVGVTNIIMRSFPNHHGMNRDGCIVLQRVCRHLPKSERKRLGVVASLGAVVASDSIDQYVKDIADEILEEQFRE